MVRPSVAVQLDQLGAHAGAQLGIEIGQGLIQKESDRLADQRPAERHALALAAGERAGLALQQRADAEHARDLLDARLDFGGGPTPQAQARSSSCPHAHMRIERVVLEHEGKIAIARIDVVGARLADDRGRPR